MVREKMAYGKYEWYIYRTYKLLNSKHFWIGIFKGFSLMLLTALAFVSFYLFMWIVVGEDEMYQLKRKEINNSGYYQKTRNKTNHLANLQTYYEKLSISIQNR